MWHHQDEEERPRAEVFSGFPNDNNPKDFKHLENFITSCTVNWFECLCFEFQWFKRK